MFGLIRIVIALIGSAICGAWDLKTTDIPDPVCILMIALGIGLHGLESYIIGSAIPLISCLMVGGAFLLFALAMYFLGQWGGGDGELLVAIGVLLPAYGSGIFPFPVNLFTNLFIIGAIYSICYAALFAVRNNAIRKKIAADIKGNIKLISLLTLFVFAVLFSMSVYFGIDFTYSIAMAGSIFLLAILYRFTKLIEKGFYRKIPAKKLKQGDMIGQDLPGLKIYKRFIRGLTKMEVSRIKRARKFVLIREGVRFGPVFFIALVFTLVFGNLILLLF